MEAQDWSIILAAMLRRAVEVKNLADLCDPACPARQKPAAGRVKLIILAVYVAETASRAR